MNHNPGFYARRRPPSTACASQTHVAVDAGAPGCGRDEADAVDDLDVLHPVRQIHAGEGVEEHRHVVAAEPGGVTKIRSRPIVRSIVGSVASIHTPGVGDRRDGLQCD